MSYTLFLLLNVNHDKAGLIEYIAKRLERTGEASFCFDESPDNFFSIEYLQEGSDTSLAVDIPFGAEERVMLDVFDFMTYLQEYVQFQVLDPQLGRLTDASETPQILQKWKSANLEALQQFGDGHHFLRTIMERDGKKTMVEAIRMKEESWQNHCSVALAYNRVQDAANALKHFHRASELEPDNAVILHAIGITHYNLQQYSQARDVLKEFLRFDPDNEDAIDVVQACEAKLSLNQ
jgi:tetratricopeptide (TPR) repeat protein